MNSAIVLKLLDLAILGFYAMNEYKEAEAASDPLVQAMRDNRERVRSGAITPEQGLVNQAGLVRDTQRPLDEAMERLNKLIPPAA